MNTLTPDEWLLQNADKSRASPPDFNPGNMVWLSSKNIKSARPTKKLSERWLGPFPILKKVITHAYHLKLPSQWKWIHPVFQISLLELFKTSTIPNPHQEPPPPIIIEEEEEWEVSKILDSNLERKIMVPGGMERFQSRLRKIHLGTN
ncbi:hypothetical protein O181_046207 [Austropuccinia psidii MF-1]|uniref:Tf2-1-like SH3-like domain-containing protein n=1 Tax=Austropuccinia psidii MF-1 TaxID=1389203 RepID=A0A9Q3DVD4_9BASI|nr:hypothetical protein [Austropuccinia psidii MF-1]